MGHGRRPIGQRHLDAIGRDILAILPFQSVGMGVGQDVQIFPRLIRIVIGACGIFADIQL